MLVVQIPRDVLFESGELRLSSKGEETLRSVASSLAELERHQIIVAGHTDNVPVGKKSVKYENNWELSTKRALATTTVLADAGVLPSNLAAAGFGEHDPIAPNDSENGREQNRRVELILVPDLSQLLQGSGQRASN